jgi:hypothetical protein
VPIVGLFIVLIFLHRRNKKKLAAEDARDKYKSLDFGLGGAGGKKGKGGPEMSITEKEVRGDHSRGLSLEAGSPYILPVGLHGSRESLHSLSRSQMDPHDPYRPVTFLKDNASIRSQGRGYGDNGSIYTASSAGTQQNRMGDGLLKNAQRMSTSHPMRGESLSPVDTMRSNEIKFPEQNIALSPLNPRFPSEPAPMPAPELRDSRSPPAAPSPLNVPSIAMPPPTAAAPKRQSSNSPVQASAMPSFPSRIQSQQAVVLENANTTSIISTSSYGDGFQITPPSPRQSQNMGAAPAPVAPQARPRRQTQDAEGLGVDEFGYLTNRLSIMRPLPPDDVEGDPAARAERIRSFYKEYFDDSKPEPAGGHNYTTDYYEDYGSEYHQDGAVYDTKNRGFVAAQPNAPFAEPVTRRAMTPPPRAPPRFRSNTQTGPRGPHMSNGSMASSHYAPRNMSSMSGRLPPQPKKALPPPSALSSLPTPAKLSVDAMVFNTLDFAPPVSFRDRQNGMRPDSPLGSPRPFSPSVRPHTPLASSFDDLPVMPSPHMLRKSGLFTGLDFAPPPKFRDPGSNASDAGSIRSNRSGMSAVGRNAIANGANRVSKIPKEMVFTRDDLMNQLRPKLDMVSKA